MLCQVLRPSQTTARADAFALRGRVVLRARLGNRNRRTGGRGGRAGPRAAGPPGSHVPASPPARQVRPVRCLARSATSCVPVRAGNPRSGLGGRAGAVLSTHPSGPATEIPSNGNTGEAAWGSEESSKEVVGRMGLGDGERGQVPTRLRRPRPGVGQPSPAPPQPVAGVPHLNPRLRPPLS